MASASSRFAGKALFDLSGKVALVTGASSGLGRAMATALASAGAHVLLAARRVQALEDAAADIRKAMPGSNVTLVPADLSSWQGVEDLAKHALEKSGGGVDILINAAGINLRQPCEEITVQSWEQTLSLNLGVPFFLARQLIPAMKERGWGRVVNIASVQSERAFPNSMPYGASKGGVCQLTRAMAEEWSAAGINCNAIAPGFFPTELTASVFAQKETVERLAKQTAIGRNGTMADIHGPTIFLCSPASDYITGQTLFVDGGFTAK